MQSRPPLAFYAPMKSPKSPRPSGDRTLARLFHQALEVAGFQVELASEFRSWEGRGDPRAQARLRQAGEAVAASLLSDWGSLPTDQRPAAWFTYHLYHKAPDWIGPAVCRALGIPYFLAEASLAPRQAGGPWESGHAAARDAIALATRVFNINPRDLPGLAELEHKVVPLAPFLDSDTAQPGVRNSLRQKFAARLRIDPDRYWLLSVAMMRDDSKLRSYEQLARSISRLERKDWLLLIVGDGAAELQVRDYFRLDLDRQIYFLGRRDAAFIQQLMAAADLFVWPAIDEAIGMVALEALAAGLPAVCGDAGGIGQIVRHGETGLLVEDPAALASAAGFTAAIESLLESPARLAAMSRASLRCYRDCHRIDTAASRLAAEILPHVRSTP